MNSTCVIIGAGINVSQDEADFGPEVAPIAISLAQALGTAPDRTELAAQVIRSLNALYDDFPAQNAAYLDHFRRDCPDGGQSDKGHLRCRRAHRAPPQVFPMTLV